MNEVGVDKMMKDDVCAAQCAGYVEHSLLNKDPILLSSKPEGLPFFIPPTRGSRFLEEVDLLPPPHIIRQRPFRRPKGRRRPFRKSLIFPDESIII